MVGNAHPTKGGYWHVNNDMDHLKIFVIGTRGFPNVQGGVERHCEELYNRMAEKGCEITVAFSPTLYSLEKKNEHRGEGISLVRYGVLAKRPLRQLSIRFLSHAARRNSPTSCTFMRWDRPFVTRWRNCWVKSRLTNHGRIISGRNGGK